MYKSMGQILKGASKCREGAYLPLYRFTLIYSVKNPPLTP